MHKPTLTLLVLFAASVLACGDDGTSGAGATGGTGATGASGGTGGSGASGATGGSGATGATGGGGTGGQANTCAPVNGAGTEHTAVAANETWTAATSPHIVTTSLTVPAGITLTIDPCAEVRMRPGVALSVEGNLVANGLADKPISIIADDALMAWRNITVEAPGTLTLAHTLLTDGGLPDGNALGLIDARGIQADPLAEILKVDHVTIRRSQTHGVSLRENAAFTADSNTLDIGGTALAPLRILPRLATNVPTGTYDGEVDDEILVETEVGGDVNFEDVTFHDRGVPYRIGGPMTLGQLTVGPSSRTLTLDPGVELRFKNAGWLYVDSDAVASSGTLIAVGAAANPIVLTSVSKTAGGGDWRGVVFESVTPTSRIDHAEIRFAGGASQANGAHCDTDGSFSDDEDAAATVQSQPATQLITNTLISDSPKAGINLAYFGAYVDFVPTNTFTNVALCKVTTPRAPNGSCAAHVCP